MMFPAMNNMHSRVLLGLSFSLQTKDLKMTHYFLSPHMAEVRRWMILMRSLLSLNHMVTQILHGFQVGPKAVLVLRPSSLQTRSLSYTGEPESWHDLVIQAR